MLFHPMDFLIFLALGISIGAQFSDRGWYRPFLSSGCFSINNPAG